MVYKFGSYWNCECHMILHTELEAKQHQYQHTLKRIKEL